ncbi:hypothetical protein WJX82_005733 [Trebouxia sp. C0006]
MLGTVARQEAGDKMSFINAALVSGFKGLKVTGSIQEALLQVTQDVFTPKIVKDYAKEVKQDAAATADHFNNFQVEMSASLAQVQEKMNMQAEQLEAAELQLVQQQARLTSQEAELHESETAFQERMTAHSLMHSRLNGASSGRFSLAAGAANPAPVDILINPLWSLGSALPSSPLIQAVEDVLPGDLRLVTTPLGIPNTGCHALEPCKVVFPTTAQQVAAHTGPAVKSASTAQKSSKRTATMSRRQVNLSPIPLNFSSADICSTSSGDCNRGTAKGGDVKGAPAYKTAGRISSKGNRKPIAGICSPKQCSLHQRHPS